MRNGALEGVGFGQKARKLCSLSMVLGLSFSASAFRGEWFAGCKKSLFRTSPRNRFVDWALAGEEEVPLDIFGIGLCRAWIACVYSCEGVTQWLAWQRGGRKEKEEERGSFFVRFVGKARIDQLS